MSFDAFVATIILVLFLVTILIAMGSYGAYKLRERRRPVSVSARAGGGEYFERVEASHFE